MFGDVNEREIEKRSSKMRWKKEVKRGMLGEKNGREGNDMKGLGKDENGKELKRICRGERESKGMGGRKR